MPCGGIWPMAMGGGGYVNEVRQTIDGGCFICQRGGCRHWIDEWETFIHARCVPQFLQTQKGKVVMAHKHTVILDFAIEVPDPTPWKPKEKTLTL
jgi:hypothetical protein